jgi:class 3 adenylate cyclase
MIATLEAGRDAATRHDWAAAVAALTEADRDGRLSGEDLELLGTASWWLARPDESAAVLERAFNAYTKEGRGLDAARVAMSLAYQAYRGLSGPAGASWAARAERLLANEPENHLHARALVYQSQAAIYAGRLDQGIELADKAIEIARRHDAADELHMATSFRGVAKLFAGDLAGGMQDIDESAAAASSGQLDLRMSSDIFCVAIGGCRNIGDLERAGQWADEGERWMERNGAGGFPGVCKVHRAELKMFRGEYAEAEQEARKACEELQRFRLLDGLGFAYNAIGEVRLRMGDLDGAAAEFDRAYEHGHDAQPGLALLQLARGEIDDARRSLGRALAAASGNGGPTDLANRARLLPAQVEITLAAGDLDAARAAVEELESIAVGFERPYFKAGALTARGELLLGERKPVEASPVLDQSWRLWQTHDLPYEAARARLLYGEALAAEGDQAMARRDLLAARSTFERLGARLDVERVDRLLGPDEGGAAAARPAERVERTFMFTDIVVSTDLVGIMGDDAWGELLHWHDRELRSSIADHHGLEVSHTGDGFFAAFDRATDAIECAVDIQRRLVRHRRDHGFAPWVRIGLHTAEATREGGNYRGQGVHVAARVGAVADREEIVVSSSVVDAAGRVAYRLSEPRSAQLKGVREPVELRTVEWRAGAG